MPILFYYIPVSAPCRAVEMLAEHLGINLEKKHVDLFTKEQMTSEFLGMNPQHCLPTINDDGFILWESRTVMTYLINKYAPESPLYPKDVKARAVVDRMLNFDVRNLYVAVSEFCVRIYSQYRIYGHPIDPAKSDHMNKWPQVYDGLPKDPEKEEKLKSALEIFEKMLEKTPYAAGNHLTIADFSNMTGLVFLEEILDYSFGGFPNISTWLQRLKEEAPKYKEINEVPLKKFREFWNSKNNKTCINS